MKKYRKKKTSVTSIKRQPKGEKDNNQSVQNKKVTRNWGLAARLEPKSTKGKK